MESRRHHHLHRRRWLIVKALERGAGQTVVGLAGFGRGTVDGMSEGADEVRVELVPVCCGACLLSHGAMMTSASGSGVCMSTQQRSLGQTGGPQITDVRATHCSTIHPRLHRTCPTVTGCRHRESQNHPSSY
jgi:hypothetical protein